MRGLHLRKSATVPQSKQGRRNLGSVQQGYVAAEAVMGDVLVLATPNPTRHDYRALLEVSSVNYALKTAGEQEAILAGYRAFLNGLTFPVQLLVRVRLLDLISYSEQIRSMMNQDGRHRFVEASDPSDNGQSDIQHAMWSRLAEDEAQYVLDLAAHKTLLDRRSYLVLPADEQAAFESSTSSGSGLHLSRSLLPGVGYLPFPGRKRRQRAAQTRSEQHAARILDLRSQSVSRELSRIGLETQRLAGTELVAVYHQTLAPEQASRYSIGEAHLNRDNLADLLAPAAIELSRDDVRLDDMFCRTLAVVSYPRHVYPGWLERLIDIDEPLDVVLHLHPQSTAAMIRQLSHRLIQLHSSRLLNEERGRIGTADLGVAYEDVERTRERLQCASSHASCSRCVFVITITVPLPFPHLHHHAMTLAAQSVRFGPYFRPQTSPQSASPDTSVRSRG
jgi:hypothetical protein